MALESLYFAIIFGRHEHIMMFKMLVKLLDLISKYLQYNLLLTLQRFEIFMQIIY